MRYLLFFSLPFFCFFAACSGSETASSSGKMPDHPLFVTPSPSPLQKEAGFAPIPNVIFSLQNDAVERHYTSDPALLWYVFQPAAKNPETSPLAVFFNGGPGATSMYLFTLNTAEQTMATDPHAGNLPRENPHTWTGAFNCVWIDARNAGFSALWTDDADDASTRKRAFDAKNFNPYLDGADFLRVLLHLFSRFPDIRKNPVILVGESYGGLRSQIMLHLVHHLTEYRGADFAYTDTALIQDLSTHFSNAYPDLSVQDAARRQFGHQVLIQPLLSGNRQQEEAGKLFEMPGSIIHTVAEQTGTTYTPCTTPGCDPWQNAFFFIEQIAGRSIYDAMRETAAFDAAFDNGVAPLTVRTHLSTAIGMDAAAIQGLLAENRTGLFRYAASPASRKSTGVTQNPIADFPRLIARMPKPHPGVRTERAPFSTEITPDLATHFGELPFWDDRFTGLQYDILLAFYANDAIRAQIPVSPMEDRFFLLFLENIKTVETFITHAENDLILYGPALPAVLESAPEVETVIWATGASEGADPVIQVTFAPDAIPDGTRSRTIAFPFYPNASHSVPLDRPFEILNDVTRWYENTRTDPE